MPTYVLTDPIYGRKIKVDMEGEPTQEDIAGFFAETFPEDRELKFTGLTEDKQYMADLHGNWKAEGNEKFEGGDSELVEKDFEYWNSIEFNLTKGAYSLATTFANLEPKEAQRMLRRYDTYDKTSATGEGSRDFSEQFKGVGWAMITDPSSYAGGFGIIKNLVAKNGARSLLKSILIKAATPMGVGAAYGAAADAEHQAMLMELGGQEEYSGTQTGVSAGMGAVLGKTAPIATKAVIGTAKAATKMLQPSKWKSGLESAEAAAMETMGGATVAKQGVIREGEELLTSGGGHAEAAVTASNRLSDEFSAAWTKFDDKYNALGELDVRPQHLLDILGKLKDKGIQGLGNIEQYVDLMSKGEISPTRALRLIRSQLGKLHQASKKDTNKNHGADEIIKTLHTESKKMFANAAQRSGKGNAAKKVDAEYAEFAAIQGRHDIIKASNQTSKASDLISIIVATPEKSHIRINEYLGEISKIAKASGNKEFVKEQTDLIGASLAEYLFKGGSGKFQAFVKSPSGKKTLLALYPDLTSKGLNRWSTILENASVHGGAATFWGRMISQTLAGTLGAGIAGKMGGVLSFIGMAKLLRSQKFQDMAMRVYAREGINQKALNRMETYLVTKGMSEKQAKKFIANISGAVLTKATTTQIPQETKDTAVQYADKLPTEF
jgi:hypothetical protein